MVAGRRDGPHHARPEIPLEGRVEVKAARIEELATAAGPMGLLAPEVGDVLGADGLGLLVLDPEGRPLGVNGRFRDLWGLAPAGPVMAAGDVAGVARWMEEADPSVAALLAGRDRARNDDASGHELALPDGRRIIARAIPPLGTASPARAWLFRDVSELQRGVRTARLLAKAADLLGRTLDYEVLAASLARVAVPDLADWCSVDILGEDGAFHRVGAAHQDDAGAALLVELDRMFPIRPAEGHLRGQVVATGRSIAIYAIDDETLHAIARDERHAAMLRRLGMCAAIWIPLAVGEEILGVMSFGVGEERHARQPFDAATLTLGEDLARRAALALRNARTFRQLRDREQQQAAVAALGQAAAVGQGLEPLFDEAVKRLARTLHVEYAKVLELLPGGEELRLVAGVGWSPGVVGLATVPADAGSQAGYTLATAGAVIVDDLREEQRFSGPQLLRDHGVISGMSVVIGSPTGPWGVLGVHSWGRRHFTPDDVHFLQSVANVLSAAISRRRSETELRERDDRLEMTLSASRTGFWEWELATDTLFWSDEICRLHALPAGGGPATVEQYLRLVHPDDRERFRSEVQASVQHGSQFDLEYRIVWPDGTIHWTNGVGRVFRGADGHPTRMAGLGRDITDRKLAEEERDALIEAERERGVLRDAFVGVVSHELRTPITTIFGGVKLLSRMEGRLDEQARREVLADIEAEADRLGRLVEDLLVLSRAERGRIDIESEPIKVSLVAAQALRAEAARWPGITFTMPEPTRIPIASGDGTAIEQVIRNLLSNAAKYSPSGSTVTLWLDVVERGVRVRVLDEGHGFDRTEADQLFELFYRAPEATRAASGAGIGLFVVRRLVEAMGGDVWAAVRPGGGSEFGFTLPVLEVDGD
jgi:PAS domain S-box-containing protein